MSDTQAATRVIYHGRVQGVGFRFTTHEIARQFRVAGFVRNLSDGTVELLAQGEPGEVRRFLSTVAQRLEGNIALAEETDVSPEAGLSGFGIRS